MQWTSGANAGFSSAPAERLYTPVIDSADFGAVRINVEAQRAAPDSLFHTIQRMIAVRKQHPAFGRGDFNWVNPGTQTIAAYTRQFQGETILVINNLGDTSQVALPPQALSGAYTDAFTGNSFAFSHPITLQPYQYLWLVKKD
jgi:maltose alpha-D-glucosyltransferase / alpha-amylase